MNFFHIKKLSYYHYKAFQYYEPLRKLNYKRKIIDKRIEFKNNLIEIGCEHIFSVDAS